jgi:hypothetical protein
MSLIPKPRWVRMPGVREPIEITNFADIGEPPMPLGITVQIVDRSGRPTPEYHQWLMETWHWNRKLLAYVGILT